MRAVKSFLALVCLIGLSLSSARAGPIIFVGDAFTGTINLDPLFPTTPFHNDTFYNYETTPNSLAIDVEIRQYTFQAPLLNSFSEPGLWTLNATDHALLFEITLRGPDRTPVTPTPVPGPLSSYTDFNSFLLITPDGYYFGKFNSFQYSEGTHDVTFSGVLTAVPAVPEPSTWAMLLIGFAGIGFVTYRKRRHQYTFTLPGSAFI